MNVSIEGKNYPMCRLLIVSLCLILINTLALIAMRAIGSRIETPESRLFATGDCSQPCWHGIQPGKTTIDQAEAILRNEPDFVTGIERYPDEYCALKWHITTSEPGFDGCIRTKTQIVDSLGIASSADGYGIPLNNVIFVLGVPVSVSACNALGANTIIYRSQDVGISVWVPNSWDPNAMFAIKPNVLVNGIFYQEYESYRPYRDLTHWRGFSNLYRCFP